MRGNFPISDREDPLDLRVKAIHTIVVHVFLSCAFWPEIPGRTSLRILAHWTAPERAGLCSRLLLIFGGLVHGTAEAVTQLLIDHIQVHIQIGRERVMSAVAIGLVAFFPMACLKDQVPILNGQPHMFARIAIAPFQEEPIFVLIEAALPIGVTAIDPVSDLAYPAGIDHSGRFRRAMGRCFRSPVLLRNAHRAGGMPCFADHLLDPLPLLFAQPMTLPQNGSLGSIESLLPLLIACCHDTLAFRSEKPLFYWIIFFYSEPTIVSFLALAFRRGPL